MPTEKETHLIFVAQVLDGKCLYNIINNKQEYLGRLRKINVGQWQSWCLFLDEDSYLSASCIDEVREKIRSLNNNKIRVLGDSQ